jgi:hypothetical protein
MNAAVVTASELRTESRYFYVWMAGVFSWTCFYFVQTALISARRTMDHRAWGLAGIALFSVLMCSILVTQSAVLSRDEARGMGEAARRFA